MAKQEPVVPSKQPNNPAAGDLEVTPDWEKVLYSTERIRLWMMGDLTLQELNAISGPEMLSMAMIGFQLYEQGKLDEAKVIFLGLNALDHSEPYYLTALGAVFLAKEELDSALHCFNEAIKLNNKEIASYVNRGEVFLRQGKILEAAQDFKAAVDLDPKGLDPLTHRARVLAAAALEMIEQAQKEGDGGDEPKKSKPAAKSVAAPAKKPAGKPAGKKK